MVGAVFAQLDRSLKLALPVISTVLAVLLSVVPLPIPEYSMLAPNVVLICAFYWIVHRPDLFPAWCAFLVGLLDDALSGAPLGLNALVLLLVHYAIVAQHKFFRGKAFWLIWASFALIATGAAIVTAIVAYAAAHLSVPVALFATQLALTIAIYPAIGAVLGRVQRLFLTAG
ncbi:MAG: rod shape-determining protein MreD [Alphaproteobacteria bacterium]|nr:rod shape-determining protein MreD [Alphaproteobacteria bacterium]MBN9496171.1 rod shape-determining protein MreD [Alphaproteobacteria bacterium]